MARVCLDRRSRGVYLHVIRQRFVVDPLDLNALLALVEQPQLSPLVGVDDGEDLGDALANVMNAGELGVGASSDLSSPERDQLPSIRQCSIPFNSTIGKRTT